MPNLAIELLLSEAKIRQWYAENLGVRSIVLNSNNLDGVLAKVLREAGFEIRQGEGANRVHVIVSSGPWRAYLSGDEGGFRRACELIEKTFGSPRDSN